MVATAVGLAVVGALALPVIAGALPGEQRRSREASRSANAVTKMQSKAARQEDGRTAGKKSRQERGETNRSENLRKRVNNRVRARAARFDAAGANIGKRIDRVAAIADKVEAAGGDVGVVRTKLDEARDRLATAKAIEVQLAEELNAITAAADKRSAFEAAKSTGRRAVAELKLARSALREAAHLLRGQIEELVGEHGSPDAPSPVE